MTRSKDALYILTTVRLGLRRWSADDIEPFAAMNQDSKVMRYFPKRLTKIQTEDYIASIERHFVERGYGLYATDELLSTQFIGLVGFNTATFEADFTPCTEISWRLDSRYWNKGYATEAARACLKQGFETFDMSEILSFTSVLNKPSIAVMKRIGLRHRMNFKHPRIEEENTLCEHVLYGLSNEEYSKSATR